MDVINYSAHKKIQTYVKIYKYVDLPGNWFFRKNSWKYTLAFIFLIFSFNSNATKYYVSNSGNDSKEGTTPETAWQSISKVNENDFAPGDQILFNRGDMWRGETIKIEWSGVEGNPIVFGAYGAGDRPVFNGAEIITSWTSLSLNGKPNIWVTPSPLGHYKAFSTVVVIDDDRFMPVDLLSNLDADLEFFVEDSTGTVGDSIYVYSLTNPSTRTAELSTERFGVSGGSSDRNITIKNLEFRYYGYAGINFSGTQSYGNCLVDHCNFYFNRQVGVQFVYGHNNNTVQNSTSTYNGNGFYANIADNISFIGNTITNSIAYRANRNWTDGHGIGCYRADNVLIEHNILRNNEGGNIGYDAQAADDNNGTIRYNKLYSTVLGCLSGNVVTATSTLDIYYNLINNDVDYGGYAWGFNQVSGQLNFYNNTVIQQHDKGGTPKYMMKYNYADNIVMKNNLFYNAGVTGDMLWIRYSSDVTSDYNIWYNSGGTATYYVVDDNASFGAETLTEWTDSTAQDANSLIVNPLFTTEFTDFTLQAGSPAINAGVDVGLTQDILGNPIVGSPDIGAYEYGDITDIISPVVSAFTIPATATSLTVPIADITATDNIGVTGYLVTETSSAPTAGASGWSLVKPATYTFSSTGSKTLYAWAKDVAGNISTSLSATMTISYSIDPVYSTENISICEGGSYEGWTTTGQYQRILTAVSGADSIVTTNLTINPVYHISEDITILEGESYQGWLESGQYERTFPASTGCDSVVTTNLTVILKKNTTENVTICEGSSYESWTTTGQYQRILTAASGADSIVTTNLIVYPVYHIYEDITILEGENYQGWSENGQYERTLPATTGCDSIITTNLSVALNRYTTEDISICEGSSYESWTSTSQYQRILTAASGADSVVTTNLTVNPDYTINEDITIAEGESYQGWDIPGQYERTLSSVSGCDSIVTTNLTVKPTYVINLPTAPTLTLGNTEVFGTTSTNYNRRALPVTFSEDGDITSISIYHNGGSGELLLAVYSDQSEAPSSLLGVTASTPVNSTEGWQTIPVSSPVKFTSGQTVWLAWVFENNPGIRYASGAPGRVQSSDTWSAGMPSTFGAARYADYQYSIYCSYTDSSTESTITDNTKPTITSFTIPATYTSLTIPISGFEASDNTGVTGYLVKESSGTPNANDNGWSSSAPNSYTFSGTGTKTLYAWVKDAADNVSASLSAQVVITLTATSTLTLGNKEVFGATSTNNSRRALPVTFGEDGDITSISIYHNGGYGKLLLAVYSDQSEAPSSRLGITTSTVINSTEGWQTIPLSSPVTVTLGQTVWLAWVFENNPGIRFAPGLPGRVQASDTWSAGMPTTFGAASSTDYQYSIYCSYTPSQDEKEKSDEMPNEITQIEQNQMFIGVTAAFSNGMALQAGDKIEVYDGSLSIGSVILTESIDSMNTNSYAKVIVNKNDGSGTGFTEGNVITFKIWDSSKQEETDVTNIQYKSNLSSWNATGTFIAGSYSFVALGNRAESLVSLPSSPKIETHSIALKEGWNIFSTYLIPTSPGMDSVLNVLSTNGQLIEVVDEMGNTYKSEDDNIKWMNNIGDIQVSDGYKIHVNSDCILEITGQAVRLPLDRELKKGWNIISVPNATLSAMEFIQPLIDAGILEKVQDEKGNSIENWESIGWVDGIGNFEAGEGYKVLVNSSGFLPVNTEYGKSGSSTQETIKTSYYKSYPGNGQDHMNINISGLMETDLNFGDEIAAYDGETCVGAIKLTADYFKKNIVNINTSFSGGESENGFIEGNSIELRTWNSVYEKESQQEPTIIFGNLIFLRQSSVFIELNNQDAVTNTTIDSLKISIYPNPTSEKVYIGFSMLPEMGTKIELRDMTGKQLMIQEVQSVLEVLNMQFYPNGIYLIQTISGTNRTVNKLIKK